MAASFIVLVSRCGSVNSDVFGRGVGTLYFIKNEKLKTKAY